jgi:hypothetical protein
MVSSVALAKEDFSPQVPGFGCMGQQFSAASIPHPA